MFSGLITGLKNSLISSDNELYGRIPDSFRPFLNLTGKLSDSGDSREFRALLIWSSTVLIVMPLLASILWSIYSKKKKKKMRTNGSATVQPVAVERTGESPESGGEVVKWRSLNDGMIF